MNLPDLYARVVAKRPELAVDGLNRPDPGKEPWLLDFLLVTPSLAAALILAKWVEALPVGHGLDHHPADNRESEDWQVRWYTTDNRTGCGPCEATPIEALAAFWLEYEP